jgi:hypothetical protein
VQKNTKELQKVRSQHDTWLGSSCPMVYYFHINKMLFIISYDWWMHLPCVEVLRKTLQFFIVTKKTLQ